MLRAGSKCDLSSSEGLLVGRASRNLIRQRLDALRDSLIPGFGVLTWLLSALLSCDLR